MFIILFQLVLLLLTAWGWGYWVWKALRFERCRLRWGWFFCGLGGFAVCMLFLQNLIYLDLPVKITAWVAVAVTGSGVIFSCRNWRRAVRLTCRSGRTDKMCAAFIFVVVFSCQSVPLFYHGPANYYGKAHTDQANYVLIGQFLIEKQFSTSLADASQTPWLVKPIHFKLGRIGQSVINAYLGVVSLSDAKRSYGTLSIFVICLGAVAVFVLSRTLAIPTVVSAIAGLWWGLLPAVTKTHLDGFFSQTSVLFVFPAIAALFRIKRGRFDRALLAFAAIYLAYVLCVYTELYFPAIAFVGCLLLFSGGRESGVQRAGRGFGIVAGSLALAAGYVPYFWRFVAVQYRMAQESHPLVLDVLVPMSGTWAGWKQIFFGHTAFVNVSVERLSIIVAMMLIVIGCFAFQGKSRSKSTFLLSTLIVPVGLAILLMSASSLLKYPFSKLLDTFTPFWIVAISLGSLRIGLGVFQRRLRAKLISCVALILLTAAAISGSVPHWREVIEDHGILSVVDSAEARECYAVAEAKKDGMCLVAEPHPILCEWLIYHARHVRTYVDSDLSSDQPVPSELYKFRPQPPFSTQTILLNSQGPRLLDVSGVKPEVTVWNGQGIDGEGKSISYWIGSEAVVEVIDFNIAPQNVSYEVAFDATAGPANPEPRRTLALIGADGATQRITFTTQASVHFQITPRPGKNIYTLRVLYPTEQTQKQPTDPRNHMVQISMPRLKESSVK
jgi:hypothetical protein